ncbi:MAG: bifunctional pyr operon transcriptional regulator/uracil phosphoribosyltransferase PyrR [Planctomycetota bacterium]|nr:bifunctional pyr operon transcriptional regulator/uracil phosphoribosyltransferase PyrR [Planctomycetota bacterium]
MNRERVADAAEFRRLFENLVEQLMRSGLDERCALVGIERRGVVLARRLKERIRERSSLDLALGSVDITLYRDDLSLSPPHPILHKTEIAFDVNGKRIILVDDVLFTGRTVRAAISAILDFGRPAQIQLLVLVDRGNRELPIQADFVGLKMETNKEDMVEVLVKELDGRDCIDCIRVRRGGMEA